MAQKYTHSCERCGLQAHLERTGRFRDEDYRELLDEYLTLEHEQRQEIARLRNRIATLQAALEHAKAYGENERFLADRWRREFENAEAELPF